MALVGYILAILTGISLGLIGGGGSILTVPILIYFFDIDPIIATSYSLFIVGITSLAGTFTYFQQKLIHIKTAVIFGIPSIVAVYLTRRFILPAIPNEIAIYKEIIIAKGKLIMLLFSTLMITTAYSMIKKQPSQKAITRTTSIPAPLIITAEGFLVGILTGLVGAGGGFLIIPMLVLLIKMDMKEAIGTSLFIISLKSAIGFWGESNFSAINWSILLSFSLLSILGLLIGNFFHKKTKTQTLKPIFGWFVFILGIYLLLKELW